MPWGRLGHSTLVLFASVFQPSGFDVADNRQHLGGESVRSSLVTIRSKVPFNKGDA
jgi:hypothetical protein